MTPAEARALLPHDVAARSAEQARRAGMTAEQLDDLGLLFGRGAATTPGEERRTRSGPEACTAAASPLSDVIRRAIDALLGAHDVDRPARR